MDCPDPLPSPIRGAAGGFSFLRGRETLRQSSIKLWNAACEVKKLKNL
jgi:hypothetical protein